MTDIGKFLEVGLALESAPGTAEAVAQKWLKNVTADVIPRAERVVDESNRGRLEDSIGDRVVQKWFEGDIEGILHADAIGYLLANLYGSMNSSLISGSVHSHAFSLQQSVEHTPLTIFAKDGAVSQKVFGGGMVGKLELNAAVNDYLRFTASIQATNEAANADAPSYDTEYDFVAKDITVKVADTEGGLAAADALGLKELTLAFDPGLIRDHVFGSYNPNKIYNGKMGIEGTFTLNYEDTTFQDMYLGDISKYLQIAIIGAADIGGGNNPSLTFLFNKVHVTDWTRGGGRDELVTQEVSFKAFLNEADGQQSEVTLQNVTSAYAAV